MLLGLLCSQLAWSRASAEAGDGQAPSASPLEAATSSQLATVWLLPADPADQLTFSLEVDGRRQLVPPAPAAARRARAPALRFEPVCIGPCSIRLPHGMYSLALSRPGGNATATAVLSITRDARVVGHYHSARWRRLLGTTLIVTSVLVGGFLIVRGMFPPCPSDGECANFGSAIFLGTGVLSVGAVAGILLIATGRDSAWIE